MASTGNILRSLTYLQDQSKEILSHARGESRRYDPDDDDDIEVSDYWKFYREMIPYLEEYAARKNNEEISRLVGRYLQYFREMEEYQKSSFWLARLFSSSHELQHQPHDEEYIRMFQDIYDNLDNLIYQVKINS